MMPIPYDAPLQSGCCYTASNFIRQQGHALYSLPRSHSASSNYLPVTNPDSASTCSPAGTTAAELLNFLHVVLINNTVTENESNSLSSRQYYWRLPVSAQCSECHSPTAVRISSAVMNSDNYHYNTKLEYSNNGGYNSNISSDHTAGNYMSNCGNSSGVGHFNFLSEKSGRLLAPLPQEMHFYKQQEQDQLSFVCQNNVFSVPASRSSDSDSFIHHSRSSATTQQHKQSSHLLRSTQKHSSLYGSGSSKNSSSINIEQKFDYPIIRPKLTLVAPVRMSPHHGPLTLFFTDKYVFSNHYLCQQLCIDGMNFICTEQYYMYWKARLFNDEDTAMAIMASRDPKQMKLLGTKVKNFSQAVWNRFSTQVMAIANQRKYEQNKDLRQALFLTMYTVLVECNPRDQRWGIGLGMDEPDACDPLRWRGMNLLGRLLTRIRDRMAENAIYRNEVAEAQFIIRSNGLCRTD